MAVWCIGEYGEMLVNGMGMLEKEEPITVSYYFPILISVTFVNPCTIIALMSNNFYFMLYETSM